MEEHESNITPREDGRYDLKCPVCGRHTIVRLSPYESEIVEAGDETVAHLVTMRQFMQNSITSVIRKD